jgi:hypothetical protein
MQGQGLFKNFVEPETQGAFLRLVVDKPIILELMDRWACVPQRTTLIPFEGFLPPRRQDPAGIIAALNLSTVF